MKFFDNQIVKMHGIREKRKLITAAFWGATLPSAALGLMLYTKGAINSSAFVAFIFMSIGIGFLAGEALRCMAGVSHQECLTMPV